MQNKYNSGQMLVELLVAIGLSVLLFPALATSFITTFQGKAQQGQRLQAVTFLKETEEAVRSVKSSGWTNFAVNGIYHPVIVGSQWTFATGSVITNGFTQQVTLSDVYRDSTGTIVSSGGTADPSTKQVLITISWTQPYASSVSSTQYLTRNTNLAYTQTTSVDFAATSGATLTNTQVTNISGGEVKLGNNNKGKWCSPAFARDSNGNDVTINLPDGPPVAVAATAAASITIPNDVFVATAPYATSSVKLAYINTTANTATPVATLRGIFTMDPSQYAPSPTPAVGLDNNFRTNDVKYYASPSGKKYAILATNLPDKEVIAVQIYDGTGDAFQDVSHKIYKYWTHFNTRRYRKSDGTLASGNDQSPYGYGATALKIFGDKGYILSGGFLYVFDLSNIDTKSPATELDQIGCRIQVGDADGTGADCKPAVPTTYPTATWAKYSSGQTDTTYGVTGNPSHSDCSDGGNIALYADESVDVARVATDSNNLYAFIAIGGVSNNELAVVKMQSTPDDINVIKNTCGVSNGTDWKQVGQLDFNPNPGTEEAANSIYAKTDGSRVYMTSNGGANSKQFYVINTTTPSTPKFLTTAGGVPSSGFYNGAAPAPVGDAELYPKRSLTVLNGLRAVLVGKDGVANGNNAQEYQVLDMDPQDGYSETNPTFCGGLNFDQGFNDLTSVSEANGDNYVYMVTNTTDHNLKIIQGGPDNAIYVPSGTFESATFDTNSTGFSQSEFNRFVANISQPTATSISAQVAVAPPVSGSCAGVSPFPFLGPDGTANTYFTSIAASISGTIPFGNYLSALYQNPGRCFRYKTWLSTNDQTLTPILYDMTWNYSP